MKKDPAVFLVHIFECIELLENYTKGKTKADFLRQKKLQDAVVRRIEIIGEAMRYIPYEIRASHSQIPWKQIIGMRDKLVHEYFGIDLDLTWNVIKKDVPRLKKYLRNVKI